MRYFRFALALVALLPAAAVAQAGAECEYRNPDTPDWDYVRACTVRSETAGDRTTTTAKVSNGSTLTIVEQGTGEALRFQVNGRAATRLETGASRCYRTTEDDEMICIRLDGADVAPVETAAAPETGPEATATRLDLADTGFGGGEAGHCLAWVTGAERGGLIGKGTCVRRTDCAEVEGEGGMSCLIDIVWETGAETVITRQNGVYTLDGAVAAPTEQGCLIDEGAGVHFCFSQSRMAEKTYPALALPPAPDPDPAPATATAEGVVATAKTDQPAASSRSENRCSFLRDEVEVSSWTCTETVTCDAPICAVVYAFENGTTVTLDTADGQVMLMNGAKADPAAWAKGDAINVTRPGAPYTFRFTPAAAAAAAQ